MFFFLFELAWRCLICPQPLQAGSIPAPCRIRRPGGASCVMPPSAVRVVDFPFFLGTRARCSCLCIKIERSWNLPECCFSATSVAIQPTPTLELLRHYSLYTTVTRRFPRATHLLNFVTDRLGKEVGILEHSTIPLKPNVPKRTHDHRVHPLS